MTASPGESLSIASLSNQKIKSTDGFNYSTDVLTSLGVSLPLLRELLEADKNTS